MEKFVRNIFATEDLSVVTKKIIKTRYLKEVCGGRSSLSKDEKKELHGLIYSCIQEIQSGSSEPTHQPKGDENAPKERLMEDNSESIKHSHKRDKENTEPAKNSKVKRLSLEDAVRDVMDEATISEPVKKKSRKKSPETAEMDTPALVSSDSHANSKSLGKRFEDRLLSLDAALMEVQKSDPIGGQSDCDTGFNSSDGEFLQTAKLKTRKRKLSGMVVSSDSDGEIGRKNKKKRFIVDDTSNVDSDSSVHKCNSDPEDGQWEKKQNQRTSKGTSDSDVTIGGHNSDSDEELPQLNHRNQRKPAINKEVRKNSESDNSVQSHDSDSDYELSKTQQQNQRKSRKSAQLRKNSESDNSVQSHDSDSDYELSKTKKQNQRKSKKSAQVRENSESDNNMLSHDSDSDYQLSKTKKQNQRKSKKSAQVRKNSESDNNMQSHDSDSDYPLSKTKKQNQRKSKKSAQVRKNSESDNSVLSHDSDSDYPLSKTKKQNQKKSKKSAQVRKNSESDNSVLSHDSDSDYPLSKMKKQNQRKSKKSSQDLSHHYDSDHTPGGQNSDSDEELPQLGKQNKKSVTVKKEKKESSSSSSDTSLDSDTEVQPSNQKEQEKSKTKNGKKKTTPDAGSKHLKNLYKICRAAAIMPYNELKDCKTDQQKIKKINEILKRAGMKGRASMKKAEQLKLKKEAAELDMGNIICETGRSRRRNQDFFQRGQSPQHPKKEITAIKPKFSRLKGVFDSEGSSDSDG